MVSFVLFFLCFYSYDTGCIPTRYPGHKAGSLRMGHTRWRHGIIRYHTDNSIVGSQCNCIRKIQEILGCVAIPRDIDTLECSLQYHRAYNSVFFRPPGHQVLVLVLREGAETALKSGPLFLWNGLDAVPLPWRTGKTTDIPSDQRLSSNHPCRPWASVWHSVYCLPAQKQKGRNIHHFATEEIEQEVEFLSTSAHPIASRSGYGSPARKGQPIPARHPRSCGLAPGFTPATAPRSTE